MTKHRTLVQNLNIADVSGMLIAWEQFKKSNWWESDAINVEAALMGQFQAIYYR